jgi:hypothetical protein
VGLFHGSHQCWYDIEIGVVTNSAVEDCGNIHPCPRCHALTVPKEVIPNEPCISPSTLGSDELSSMMAKRQRLQQGYVRNVVGRMTDGADVKHCSLSSCKQDGIYLSTR